MPTTTDEVLREILETATRIASVGASPNPDRPSYAVVKYLLSQGYRVFPVNPTVEEVLGQKAYPDLLSLPEKIDVVQIFRKREDVPQIVEQAIQIGARVVWMQLGIANPKAAAVAEAAGLKVVMNRCMKQEHRRLINPEPEAIT